jgi:hypothetical protein
VLIAERARTARRWIRQLTPDTWLSIAADLTGPDAWQRSRPVSEWRRSGRPRLDKVPAVFLIGRPAR